MTVDRVARLERENALLRERIKVLEDVLRPEAPYRALGLTALEERLFSALMARERLSREQLMLLQYGDRPADEEVPDSTVIPARMCLIRRKLAPFGITINTVWGFGYAISPEMKRLVRERLADLAEPQVAA